VKPDPRKALEGLWQLSGLPAQALDFAALTGNDPVLPSSFAVGTAAQAAIAAAALAACEVGHIRGTARQQVGVDMVHAALECTGWFSIDGRVPEMWDKFSGLYPCADGWVRIHANFAHHREGALKLLGLDPATALRADAERAMLSWRAIEFETAAANAGLVATALRSFHVWDASEPGRAVAAQSLMNIERIGDASWRPWAMDRTRRPRGVPASSTSRSQPMASVGLGRPAAVSIRWYRRPWASTTPKAKRQVMASRALCRCRSLMRQLAT
jgi:hypothetical protein